MHEVCVGLGFCGSVINDEPRHVDDFIPASGPVTADQFVDWLFQAEGKNPTMFEQHRRAIKAAFVRHMGSSTVDAKHLHWQHR
jgi:hypothetical protein